MIVTAPPRQGKDLWSHWLAWKQKRYFQGRRVFLDEKPRRPFGLYEPFNEAVMVEELEKMSEQSGAVVLPKEIKRKDTKLADAVKQLGSKWATANEVKLQNAILYLTEFWRYMHNRNPFSPMGITVGGIIKVWGHLGILIIGVSQFSRELDAISCLPYVTHEAQCKWMMTEEDSTMVRIWRSMYVSAKGVLEVRSRKPIEYRINGAAPRPELGIRLHREIPYSELATLSEMETDIIGVLREQEQVDLRTLSAKLNILDMSGLRGLVIAMHHADRLKCLRWYDLYNSKSMVSIVHRERANRG